MREKGMLTIVIPAYNEERMIEKTSDTIKKILEKEGIENEILFVDDGSKDRTWQKIVEISLKNSQVRGIHFSRNWGKEAAIMAGLKEARGQCVVVIDCDLQHPPEKILEMYRLWMQGYDVVEGRKLNRGKEGKMHGFAAHVFYSIISKAVGYDMENASDFKLLDCNVVRVLNNINEKHTFFRALSMWVGFETTYVEFEVQQREEGESKWSLKSLVKYAISNVSSFSTTPMQIVTVLGLIMLVVSIILGGNALIQKFRGQALEGFTTVILIQLFSSSIIMISLGVIGYYIAKIYEEIKGRPRYIIDKTCGGKNG